ncbi:glucosaminidase domain-containing protein [Paradesertivirga mongoliensis]|uniref:Glucosaminidase domain-containing protein n=2 Tax=Paradesertivirga mongoliensis TaxID=2100740 RepID=A0ABW4ZNG6_9SPHI|nr:glucosaminidase domain-containing protein [Pedobacter mongoliensis]
MKKFEGLKKVSKRKVLYYALIVSISYGIGNYVSPVSSVSATENYVKTDSTTQQFSEEAMLSFMKELKIKYPETVLAQARLETGNFTSDIFKENHNLFGMKVAGKRPTSAIGVHRGHAQYRDWKDSVIDYALFQSYIIAKLPKNNIQEYRNYIQKFYSETSDYLTRIDRTIKHDRSKIALAYQMNGAF